MRELGLVVEEEMEMKMEMVVNSMESDSSPFHSNFQGRLSLWNDFRIIRLSLNLYTLVREGRVEGGKK